MFERIGSDPKLFSQIARIRDTGITVSQVVSQLVNGTPVSAVLAQYPQLEMDDIVQALSFAVTSMIEVNAVVAHDARKPLSIILGYAGILTEAGISEPERIEFSQQIVDQATRSSSIWNEMAEWAKFRYGFREMPCEQTNLPKVLESAVATAVQEHPGTAVEVKQPDTLPDVCGNMYLARAVTYLLSDETALCLNPQSVIEVQPPADGRVTVRVQRAYPAPPASLPPAESFFSAERGGLYIASRMLQSLGSSVRAEPGAEHVTFVFALDVWKGA
jgi:uncharacterized protein (DUF433 family)